MGACSSAELQMPPLSRGNSQSLVNAMSNRTPCEIVVAGPQVHHFLKDLKGIISLSMTRGEGFLGIYERMREIACEYCTEEQIKTGLKKC